MAAYDWSQFHVRMYYLAPLAEVFRCFSSADGLESCFVYNAQHLSAHGICRASDESVQSGDSYYWNYVHDVEHVGM